MYSSIRLLAQIKADMEQLIQQQTKSQAEQSEAWAKERSSLCIEMEKQRANFIIEKKKEIEKGKSNPPLKYSCIRIFIYVLLLYLLLFIRPFLLALELFGLNPFFAFRCCFLSHVNFDIRYCHQKCPIVIEIWINQQTRIAEADNGQNVLMDLGCSSVSK